jgi:hypothetical protein
MIPHSSRTSLPEAPAYSRESPHPQRRKALRFTRIPAYPCSTRKPHDRPVTPEVAGSSPVAPVRKVPARGPFASPSPPLARLLRGRCGAVLGTVSRRGVRGWDVPATEGAPKRHPLIRRGWRPRGRGPFVGLAKLFRGAVCACVDETAPSGGEAAPARSWGTRAQRAPEVGRPARDLGSAGG